MPFPCEESATANATSAERGSRKRAQLARATTRSSPSTWMAPTSDPRSFQSGSRNGTTRPSLGTRMP